MEARHVNFELDDYQRDLVESVREVGAKEFGERFAPTKEGLPRAQLRMLADAGYAGMMIGQEDGGQGGTLLDAVLALEAMAAVSSAGADCLQALNFGAVQQLMRHGSDRQRMKFLPDLLSGQKIVTIAMSEPAAGSDVASMETVALVDGAAVVLNGRKIFTSNADVADYFLVWANFGTSPSDIGSVVVERDTSGFSIDTSHSFMSGERYGMLYFDDCRVPNDYILVQDHGLRRMMAVFNVERLGNAARSLGYGAAALRLSLNYAKARVQFGRALAEMQGLQWRLAEMKMKIDSARLLLYRAAATAASGIPTALDSSLAKLSCNRAGYEVAHDAMQIMGGYGYDDESDVNYIYRRTRGWLIAGGTVEQMLNRIAREMLRSGP